MPCGFMNVCGRGQIIILFINLQMKVKQKRIYSQEPHYSTQGRQQKLVAKQIMLVRAPSFQDEQLLAHRNTSKLAKISKMIDNNDQLAKETQSHKDSMAQNERQGRIRFHSKRISEHKIKSSIVKIWPKQYGISQIDAIYTSKGSDLIEIKLNMKERKKRPKNNVKMVYFTKGNNHNILKEIFLTNFNFIETQLRQAAHVCWLQSSSQKQTGFKTSKSQYDDHLPEIGKNKADPYSTVYNYLQGHSQLTNKQKLYKNMRKCYPQSVGSYIPKSFIIDFKQEQGAVQESLLSFVKYYLKKEIRKPKSRAINIKNYFMEINITNKQINKLQSKAQIELDNSFHSSDQPQERTQPGQTEDTIWILKPTSLNRGRGIHLFSSLKQLGKLLSESAFQISVKMYNDNMSPKSYIIQQYIERPLLIDGFKFDMRVWVFVNVIKINGKKSFKAYLFQHGYSRLASIKYNFVIQQKQLAQKPNQNQQQQKNDDKISPKKEKKAYINNKFIHLTNNAVQKQAKDYGQFCEGNQLSIEDTVKYFQQKDDKCKLTFDGILDSMKKMVFQSVNSVKERIISANTNKTFQLLGYDFLLDESYNIWLIEVNCNPCLEESSQLLGKLLRQMLSGLVVLSDLEDPKSTNSSEGWIQVI